MSSGSQRAIQIGLRSLRGEPTQLRVVGGDLRGVGSKYLGQGKVRWRVVGFVPTGESSRDWSPFLLLRRAELTIPPRGVAGVWLTLDTTNVPPGRCIAQVAFQAQGQAPRIVTLAVQVTPSVAPRRPILIGGWTAPPEGEVYRRDYVEHGMNIWYDEMSKAEMQRRGIRQLISAQWEADEAAIRAKIERFKGLGLGYGD
jgi:hypothetical protein